MKKFMFVFIFMMTALSYLKAFADAVAPTTTDQLMSWLSPLIESVAKGDWLVTGGIVIMAVVVVLRQYLLPKWNITGWWVQVISLVVGVLANLGLGMATGVAKGDAIWTGVIMSLNANGLWTLLGQQLTKAVLGDKYQAPAEPLKLN